MNMKKLFSLLLALLMLLSCVAIAEEEDEDWDDLVVVSRADRYSITILGTKVNVSATETVDRTFMAYQIFAGTLDGEGKLGVTGWGSGVNSETILAYLQADPDVGADLQDCKTASDVAGVVATQGKTNKVWLQNFANAVANHCQNGVASHNTITGQEWENLPVGYYLLDETTTFAEGQMPENFVYTRYLVGLTSDLVIQPKDDAPALEKKIDEGDTKVDANNGYVGGKVQYELTSTVPDMTGYNQYYFIVHDTLSKGLTYNDDVVITIGDTTLANGTDYVVTVAKDEAEPFETKIKIVFNDFKTRTTGEKVVIRYSATINEDAVIGAIGNTNEAHLQYSNDPNHTYVGDNEPGEGDVTGETPDDIVVTYVTGIKLNKQDGETQEPLTGVKFKIEGDSQKVYIINEEIFKTSESGTWYRLKNGTYTDTAPTESTLAQYEDETKYEKVTVVTKETVTEPIVAEGWVDENGVMTFIGLAEGTYTITELIAPAGYNLLTEPITVVITCEEPKTISDGSETCVWTVTANNTTLNPDEDNLYSFIVENKKGSTLPSTGGMGTTVLYVGGGILVLLAFIVIISKRRATAE